VPIGLTRIAAIRPNMVMLSGARGGLGGTSGRRVTGMSQVSAMLMRPREKGLRQQQRRATLSDP
jgi:hypothetical protein